MEPLHDRALALAQDLGSRIQALLRLIEETPRPPEPRPRESDATLRRTVARLRAGLIRPADPAVDPATLAEWLERELEYRVLLNLVVQELHVIGGILASDLDAVAGSLLKDILTAFHEMKQLPAAEDPDSDVAECIRQIDRARRAASERPRK